MSAALVLPSVAASMAATIVGLSSVRKCVSARNKRALKFAARFLKRLVSACATVRLRQPSVRVQRVSPLGLVYVWHVHLWRSVPAIA